MRKGIKRQAKLSCGHRLRAHNGRRPPFGTYSAPHAPAHFRTAFFFPFFLLENVMRDLRKQIVINVKLKNLKSWKLLDE
jgi:hypothetical protein